MKAKHRSVILIVAGAAVVAVCVSFAIVQFSGALKSAVSHRVPGRFQIALSSGRWEVYQLTGNRTGTSVGGVSYTVTHQQAPILDSSALTVTAPDGRQLPVANRSGNSVETLQLGSEIFTGVASFQAPDSGGYFVKVGGRGSADVVIARPVLSVIVAALPWLGGAAAGALCVLIGLVLLLTGRRRSPATLATSAGPVPPAYLR